ncbi:adenosylcobinamide kinase/adenosylcobinamide-phosphate guanylyltransferase [Rhodoblastus acidophilus]|uniref:bifunctional adenosylcobinamide kinase/adenosylcobinamide-phosphate guanylyltransferase n=1 Tax=Rhodoblastus acidophilus TaxID=1074 RepID=UPI002224773E|nr:bifunctional adenosylcobinamide kinase/adenosylcobinamide-phosphate guanylyltransferase [Rhodoblastus acidophilus]MCW2283857.1 adenosylcobinamide kinase/adenosylcobinamide-phosphate guanylyltransferase [Rhodoblastus acidophilus]MCW2332553.1 adenosylcobinamide kinase/adenosylcobinamide-phosphate guanylyltransferase [Rhodoblastus acidophilus]
MTATLVLGGARSGKTGHALELARASGLKKFMIVTAPAVDESMATRIARHRAERANESWTVFEEQTDVARLARRIARPDRVVVIDCLTLWLSNLFFQDTDLAREADRLAAALAGAEGPIVAISNEIGLGVSPPTQIGNDFRDAQGLLNQRIARACDTVVLVAAGLPLKLK